MAKVVLITGCSSGLGRALALRLHAQQDAASGERAYTVYASARDPSTLKDLQAQGLSTVQLDVTKQKSVDSAVRRVIQEAGHIDVLINNAGLSRVGPVVEQPLSEVQEVMDTNFTGVVRVTQAVAPYMMANRSGIIVMIGSVVSMLATPFGGAYSASKAALLALSDSMRLELQPFGVHLTYVTAGAIKTSISDNILSSLNMAHYERPASLYRPLVPQIRSRAEASQDPKICCSAETAADQIAAVINRTVLPASAAAAASSRGVRGVLTSAAAALWPSKRARPGPPTWLLAGGNALVFWLTGLVQKVVGWPVNGMLARRFGLDQPIAAA